MSQYIHRKKQQPLRVCTWCLSAIASTFMRRSVIFFACPLLLRNSIFTSEPGTSEQGEEQSGSVWRAAGDSWDE